MLKEEGFTLKNKRHDNLHSAKWNQQHRPSIHKRKGNCSKLPRSKVRTTQKTYSHTNKNRVQQKRARNEEKTNTGPIKKNLKIPQIQEIRKDIEQSELDKAPNHYKNITRKESKNLEGKGDPKDPNMYRGVFTQYSKH